MVRQCNMVVLEIDTTEIQAPSKQVFFNDV